jgi:hypothetical protein
VLAEIDAGAMDAGAVDAGTSMPERSKPAAWMRARPTRDSRTLQ